MVLLLINKFREFLDYLNNSINVYHLRITKKGFEMVFSHVFPSFKSIELFTLLRTKAPNGVGCSSPFKIGLKKIWYSHHL
jgi:hypothetical protein